MFFKRGFGGKLFFIPKGGNTFLTKFFRKIKTKKFMSGNKTKIRYSDDSDLREEKEFEVPKIPVINFKSDGLTLLMYNIITIYQRTYII